MILPCGLSLIKRVVPFQTLISPEFKKVTISCFLQDILERNCVSRNSSAMKVVGLAAAIAGAASPASPIVVPIVAGVALAAFLVQVVKEAPQTVLVLMRYIIGRWPLSKCRCCKM